MKVTFYERPNGRQVEKHITEIEPEDQEWFEENGVEISMEDCDFFFAIYAKHPKIIYEGEPDEITYIVKKGETCQQSMKNVRKMLEYVLNRG